MSEEETRNSNGRFGGPWWTLLFRMPTWLLFFLLLVVAVVISFLVDLP